MTTRRTEADDAAVGSTARLLDTVGRRSQQCAVALHALAATELLTRDPHMPALSGEASGDDRTLLLEALRLFAAISGPARRDDDVAEARHQTMLAYLASR